MHDPLLVGTIMLVVLMSPLMAYGVYIKHELDKYDRTKLADAARRRAESVVEG